MMLPFRHLSSSSSVVVAAAEEDDVDDIGRIDIDSSDIMKSLRRRLHRCCIHPSILCDVIISSSKVSSFICNNTDFSLQFCCIAIGERVVNDASTNDESVVMSVTTATINILHCHFIG